MDVFCCFCGLFLSKISNMAKILTQSEFQALLNQDFVRAFFTDLPSQYEIAERVAAETAERYSGYAMPPSPSNSPFWLKQLVMQFIVCHRRTTVPNLSEDRVNWAEARCKQAMDTCKEIKGQIRRGELANPFAPPSPPTKKPLAGYGCRKGLHHDHWGDEHCLLPTIPTEILDDMLHQELNVTALQPDTPTTVTATDMTTAFHVQVFEPLSPSGYMDITHQIVVSVDGNQITVESAILIPFCIVRVIGF